MTTDGDEPLQQPRGKTSKRFFSRYDRLYFWIDHVEKFFMELWEDALTSFVLLSGKFGAVFVQTFSVALVWCGTTTRRKILLPLTLLKVLIGTIVVGGISLLALGLVLIAGTAGGLLGFRNLGDYSLKEQVAVWFVLLLLVFVLPFLVPQYALFKISLVFAYGVGVLGLDFLYGQCGILSLGQAGFLLLGGYVTTWLANGFFGAEVPIVPAVIVAALSMASLGVLLGAPALRIKDYYLVIMSMTFSLAIPKILKSPHFKDFSGLREGGIAIRAIKPYPIFAFLSPAAVDYYFVAISALILFYFAYHLIHHSQVGRAFKTIKCDNEISMIMGIPVIRYKLLAFSLSAIYGGFCGAFLNILTKFIHPNIYGIHDSVNFLVANVVGGPGSLLGSLIGGAFLAYEPDFELKLASLLPQGKELASAFYGVILIFAVFLVPRGIAGELSGWFKSRLQSLGRRGVYQFNPPPDYDYLPEDKAAVPLERSRGGV